MSLCFVVCSSTSIGGSRKEGCKQQRADMTFPVRRLHHHMVHHEIEAHYVGLRALLHRRRPLHVRQGCSTTEKKGRRAVEVARAFTGLYLLASRLTALVLQPTAAYWLKPAKNKLTCCDFTSSTTFKFLQIHIKLSFLVISCATY